MKHQLVPLLLACATAAAVFAADDKKKDDKVKSDILGADKRRATVELAQQLTRPPVPEPLPADLAQPFNPPGFDLPDRNEVPPVPPPTAGGGGGTGAAPSGGANVAAGGGGGAVQPAAIAGEREKLDSLAAKIPATGTVVFGGERRLSFGTKNVRIGSDFTVTLNGQDYVLKLVAVDATNFTVRLGNEEVTRPITPRK